MLQLIGLDDDVAPERARQLVERARGEVTDGVERERVVELVLTTLVYKFPNLEREALRQMLGLDELKQTRFYQEAKEDGREELLFLAVPALLETGMTVEQIAEKLKADVATVERIIQQQREQN